MALFTEFKESMERAERHFGNADRHEGFSRLFQTIDEHIDSLPYEEEYPHVPSPPTHSRPADGGVVSGGPNDIFLDIDED